jgi:peroxiredoxin family protein
MDLDVTIFFTFYRLDVIKKESADNLKVSLLVNPAMSAAVMKSMFKKTRRRNHWPVARQGKGAAQNSLPAK